MIEERLSGLGNDARAERSVRVVLYTRPGCHLCEGMKTEMLKAGISDLYTLEEINIESDAELLAHYRLDIPILTINGVEAFKHRLTADSFHAYLKKCAR